MKNLVLCSVFIAFLSWLLWKFILSSWFLGPWYVPGSISSSTTILLEPPLQTSSSFESNPWSWVVTQYPPIVIYAESSKPLSPNLQQVVLVIHGGPGVPPHHPWEGLKIIEEKSNFRFIYYHQRGCGRSTRPFNRMSDPSIFNYRQNTELIVKTLGLAEQVADIERIRRILRREGLIDRKIILLGHSFGGFLGSLYAAEFPEMVESLILVSPANLVTFPPQEDIFEIIRSYLNEEEINSFDEWLDKYLDFSPHFFSLSETSLAELHLNFTYYWMQAAKNRTKDFSIVPPPAVPHELIGGWIVQSLYLSMGFVHDYSAALQQVTSPVLIIHGPNDLQSEASCLSFSQYFPKGEMKVVEGAGHFAFHEKPELFADVVLNFLTKV